MTTRHGLDIIQLTHPGDAGPAIRQELTACWIAVTNAGGAAGFPFPPVNGSHVTPAVDALAASLEPHRSRILLARKGGALADSPSLAEFVAKLLAQRTSFLLVHLPGLPWTGRGGTGHYRAPGVLGVHLLGSVWHSSR